MDSPSSAVPAGDARRSWILLVALCALTLAYWGIQYHPFLLPNNDYYSFQRTADSLARFELPDEFKRMPVFPAMVAALAPLMPRPPRDLNAALVVNIAFSIGSLVLLHLLALRTIGAEAILVPVLFATTVQFHAMGLQPLVEPSLGFSVLLTFVLFQARSPWQYAAAFAVGLGRVESASIIPVLFLVNSRWDGRIRKHAALAVAASSGVIVWTLLGAFYGEGQNFYLSLMEGMGWKPAPEFLFRELRESLAFVNVHGLVLAPLVVAAIVPLAVGLVRGLREFPREAVAMAAFLAICTGVVGLFGVDKARYVYPTMWIVALFTALGVLRIRDLVQRWLAPRVSERQSRWLLVGAALAWAGALAVWLVYLQERPALEPPALDVGYALACLGLVAVPLLQRVRPPRALGLALACGTLVFFTAPVVGGVARKKTALYDIHYANYGTWLLAGWLQENIRPNERYLVLGKKHIQFLSDIPKHQLLSFSKVTAKDVGELPDFMRSRGLTHAVWTHRGEARNPSANYYHQAFHVDIAEAFRAGEPVPGFEHVATLPVPKDIDSSDVQIYRLLP